MKSTECRSKGNQIKTIHLIIIIGFLLFFQSPINAGEGIIVTGVVETTKLDNGDITSVIIDSRLENGEVYEVVLNAVGKKLGQEMNGNLVEVIGSVRNEDGKNWVEVKKFEKADTVE
jgi:hypothetical protein